jgi:hypothetical protein
VGAHAVLRGRSIELLTFLAGEGAVYEGVHEGAVEEAEHWAPEAARMARHAVGA